MSDEFARTLNGAAIEERRQQDEIGFGQEGNELRARVESFSGFPESPSLVVAQANLRNYYIAKLALIGTEVAEAIEELRQGHGMTDTYHSVDALQRSKPEGVPSELADIIIRVLSLSGELELDIGAAVEEKRAYNKTRAIRHGGKVI